MAGRIDNPAVPPSVTPLPVPAAERNTSAQQAPPGAVPPRAVSPTENQTSEAARSFGIGSLINTGA
ncbi:MAG: hypothetical protein COS94_06960 [Candidatus Hydrogenedentes bacterium CG07_land_8_20_14_0_80_42_17]|nr:MAG: hypothetical protein AUJ18_02340 [Candidatus Hydrogenedentes bacterium CG1_02_42_14]PIU47504.1 MAG: hypothetical protein COS94_06960 [Candidatus Hydrogenedentes bacterium CG07_land_8_20_14_0_80_42_17]